MYTHQESVNILTALLAAHGVRHAVVCPGSRNAPIVHNLNECPAITCYAVTDERSAGFFALGVAQATDEPVVVCVTSGSALLNVAPAVAEAHYQHQSLIVISADRPAAWIDQLDGQTLQQPGALAPWVAKTVNLPEIDSCNPQTSWHCNRLVNEALIEASADARACVHINVPLSEPLFRFDVATLPEERVIRRYYPAVDYDCLPQQLVDDMLGASRPLIVFGQYSARRFTYEAVEFLFSHVTVLHEALSPLTAISPVDEMLTAEGEIAADTSLTAEMLPDFILYVGDAIVSKRLKYFLRKATDARCWRVSVTGRVEDTFQNLRGIVVGDVECVLQSLSSKMLSRHEEKTGNAARYRRQWLKLMRPALQEEVQQAAAYGDAAVVQQLEQQLESSGKACDVHYANSTALRLANRFARSHPVWCNRGVNGIEGSLSTAVGFAAVMASQQPERLCICVIGDLSFFYDQNALWNHHVSPQLRIVLLNNGHGAIFDQLPNLSASPVARSFVAGAHSTTAEGVCQQNGVGYRAVHNSEELHEGLQWLLSCNSSRPLLLEAFT